MLNLTFLDPRTLSTADIARWRTLSTSATTPNPFFAPEFVLPAVTHLPSRRVRLLVARAGREWVGAMPVVPSWHWHGLPGPVLSTWAHSQSFLDAPLLRRGAEPEALAGLLHAGGRRAGLVALSRVPAEGPYAAAAAAAAGALGVSPVVWYTGGRAAIGRDGTGDYVRVALGAKRYGDVRRRRRKLERDLGAEVVAVDRAGDPAAVDRFLALEASGWKGAEGTALASAGAADFFRAMCAGFAAHRRLRLLSLEVGDRVIAMEASLIAGDTLFAFKIAHDETLSSYSPGIQLIDHAARDFHQRTELRWFDSCSSPSNETMNRTYPDRRQLASTLIPGRGVAGFLARTQAVAAATLRDRLRG